jgi:hypothetical protein
MKKSVTWHLAGWTILLLFWLFVAVILENVNGPMFSNKYLYSLEPSTQLSSDDKYKISSILSLTDNKFSDTAAWPSGQRMNMFKNELGCYGAYNEDIHDALENRDGLGKNSLSAENLLNHQRMYNPSSTSVCTCIDQLYYASFWKEGQLPTSVRHKLSAFLNTSITLGGSPTQAEKDRHDALEMTKLWMLGTGGHGAQGGVGSLQLPYDGVGFVSLMQLAQSTDVDGGGRVFSCADTNTKDDTVPMDVTQCVMRRDAAILSVCTRSAEGVQMIESRGIFNASRIKNFGVTCLFLYIFLTLFRHMDQVLKQEDKDSRWNNNWLTFLSIVLPAHVLLLLYYAVNVIFSFHWHTNLSRSDPHRAGVLTALVITVTVVGMIDAVYAAFGVWRNRWLERKNAVYSQVDTQSHIHNHAHKSMKDRASLLRQGKLDPHLKRDFLPLQPHDTVSLVWTQVCIDVQYIAGFTMLLLALVLEASVTEVRSLVVVVLMVLVATFTQHLANVVRALQDMVLANEKLAQSTHAEATAEDELRVSAPVFRFFNEGDACRLYLGLAFIFIVVYLLISPRESQADPAMSVFVLTVVFFGAVSTGFDIIREVETKVTKTKWIAKNDVDKTRSYVMFFMLFLLTVQSASARYKYYDN